MGLSLFKSDWENVVDMDRNNLVFESRNQAYGAYVIRREYDRVVIIAMLLASSFLLLGALVPMVINYFKDPVEDNFKLGDDIIYCDFGNFKEDKVVTPKVEVEKPLLSVQKETFAFTAPVVEDDKIEEKPFTAQAVENPGIITSKGTSEDSVYIPSAEVNAKSGILEDDNKDYIIVSEMPEFPGGEKALLNFVKVSTVYPEFEKVNHISGTVWMSFVIDKEGNVTNIKVERGVKGGAGLEAEARRVIESMPQWKAGKNNGHPVKVQFNLPFSFTLK